MKKILFSVLSFSLLTSFSASAFACSPHKDSVEPKEGVSFEQNNYVVVKGKTISVKVANFNDLSTEGYTGYCSVSYDKNDVVSMIEPEVPEGTSKNYSILHFSGIGVGTCKVTVAFTNLDYVVSLVGSFEVQTIDFANTTVSWPTESIALDPPVATPIEIGVINNYEDFAKYQLTNFNISYEDANADNKNDDSKTSAILTNGRVDSSGKIFFDLNDSILNNQAYNGGDIIITISNNAANFKLISPQISLGIITASRNIFANINLPTKISLHDDQYYANGHFSYAITLNNCNDISVQEMNAGSSLITISETKKITNAAISYGGSDNGTKTLTITFNLQALSYNSGTINLNIRLANGGTIYKGVAAIIYTNYRQSPGDDIDLVDVNNGIYDSKYPPSNIYDNWSLGQDAPLAISITSSSKLTTITNAGYSYQDTLVFDKPSYEAQAIDQKNLATDTATVSLIKGVDHQANLNSFTKFTILSVTRDDNNNLIANVAKITKNFAAGTTYFVSRFIDDCGNLVCGVAEFNYAKADFEFMITASIDNTNQNNTGSSVNDEIHLLSTTATIDKMFKVTGKGLDNDSNLSVSSSNTAIFTVGSFVVGDDGVYFSATLIGQGKNDILDGNLTVTFTNNNAHTTCTCLVYYGAYIGKDASAGNFDTSKLNNAGSDIYLSKDAANRSIDLTMANVDNSIKPNLEFADGYSYTGIEGIFIYSAINAYFNNIIFDGNLNVNAATVLSDGEQAGILGNVTFNGDVNFTTNSGNGGVSSASLINSITDTNTSGKIAIDKKISFNGKVTIQADQTTTNIPNAISFLAIGENHRIGALEVKDDLTITAPAAAGEMCISVIANLAKTKTDQASVSQLQGDSGAYFGDITFDKKVILTGTLSASNSTSGVVVGALDGLYAPNATILFKGGTELSIVRAQANALEPDNMFFVFSQKDRASNGPNFLGIEFDNIVSVDTAKNLGLIIGANVSTSFPIKINDAMTLKTYTVTGIQLLTYVKIDKFV